MPFQVSPGVNVSEIDLTLIVPAVSTTEGALGGVFHWGPVDKPLLIDSEEKLAARYGKPSTFNAETFFTGANFLAYGNKLYVNRGIDGANNAFANSTGAITDYVNILNEDLFTEQSIGDFDAKTEFVAKYPGELGNSLSISAIIAPEHNTSNSALSSVYSSPLLSANSSSSYWTDLDGSGITETQIADSGLIITTGSSNGVFFIDGTGAGSAASDLGTFLEGKVNANIEKGTIITIGNSTYGFQNLTVKAIYAEGANTQLTNGSTATCAASTTGRAEQIVEFNEKFRLAMSNNTSFANGVTMTQRWKYYNVTDSAPGQSDWFANVPGANAAVSDEMTIIVTDEDGKFSGTPGTILEIFEKVSRASDAKTETGESNYWKDVINLGSNYLWAINDPANMVSNTAVNLVNISDTTYSASLAGGEDGNGEANCSVSTILGAYEPYRNAEDIDVSLILAGKARGEAGYEGQVAQWLVDNVAEYRMDCVVFASPDKADVVQNIFGDQSQDIVDFRNTMGSSSYGVLDTGYKYQYDKYNDIYRWIPLNGDIAGLAVRTDNLRDPWWSPAGFNRGQIKNIIKLAYNPEKAERDLLYKNGVNPVVTFPGQGTVLYGDKTLLSKPSAFDRINVRRLFIVLEKAIATAAKFSLFEFNDEFTRAQFVSLVEPFLRDVQGRRGIYDFKVVCDESNNTPEVIDRNEFIGDIYIKPARSINFIQLNFIAVRTGVEFSEVVGNF